MLWSECKAAAQAFLHRSDINFDALQPLVVSNINLNLVVQETEAVFTATPVDAGGGLFTTDLPTDYMSMRAIEQAGEVLDPVDIRTLRQSSMTDWKWYAIGGMKIWTLSSGDLTVAYTQRILPVTDGASNVILDRYPDIYLYGLLKHAAVVAQDEIAQTYGGQFDDAIQVANDEYFNTAFGPGMAVKKVPGGVI